MTPTFTSSTKLAPFPSCRKHLSATLGHCGWLDNTWRAPKLVRNTQCTSPAGCFPVSHSERDAFRPSTFPQHSSAPCGPPSRRGAASSLLPWAQEEHQHQAHSSAHSTTTPPVLSLPDTASAGTSAELLLQETMACLIPLTTVAQRHPTFRRGWFLPRIFELSVLLTDRKA